MAREDENVSVKRVNDNEEKNKDRDKTQSEEKETIDSKRDNSKSDSDEREKDNRKSDDVSDESDGEDGGGKPKSKMLAKLQAKMAALAAKKGIQAMIQMQIMKMIHMFLQMMYTALMNAAAAVAHAALAVIQLFTTIGTAIVNAVTAVATFLGGGAVAMATAVVAVVGAPILVVAAVAVVAVNVTTVQNIAKSDDLVTNCDESVYDSYAAYSDITPGQEANAYQIYSVCHAAGVPDINIAGILGNMQQESGIDPTSVEGYFGIELYNTDWTDNTHKGWAMNHHDTYVRGTLFPMYNNGINNAGYYGTDGTLWPGIGLIGFTGPNCTNLQDFAAANGTVWWTTDTQLLFLLASRSDGGYGGDWILTWTTPESSVYAATEQFFVHAENSQGVWDANATWVRREKRIEYAGNWFAMMADWGYGDMSYGNTLLSKLQTISDVAISNGQDRAAADCNGTVERDYDNSSLVAAALSYAWKTRDQSFNNGTDLYIQVHDAVFPGDPWYKSCDRSVASAVRWSGTDDRIPAGNVSCIKAYFLNEGRDKWMQVTNWTRDTLQPGDVLIWTEGSHIQLYVGHEAVEAKYPDLTDTSLCIVDGSLNTRSPCVNKWSSKCNTALVFRNIMKEANPKYIDVIAGMSVARTPVPSGTVSDMYTSGDMLLDDSAAPEVDAEDVVESTTHTLK